MSESIAILHGNYFQRGGGEHVADTLAKVFDAPLYYGFGNREEMPDDDVERRQLFNPGPVSKRLVRSVHQYRDGYFMWQGQHLPELYDYDVIIQSGNEFGWYVPLDDQTVVKYVHSPPRGPYDMFHRHGDSPLHRVYSLAAKTLYRHTITIPGVTVANSELVAERCNRYWGIDADVVYPPVDVRDYGPEHAESERDTPTYLTYSRLYRHKRTREIVDAFRELPDAELIVGGKGPQLAALRERAPQNVDVRGYLEESEKRRLLAECDAVIFNARNEDFGIVPIEAFASGTPVLGIRDGFTQHQITDGWNGVLFTRGEADDVRGAVERFDAHGVAGTGEELQEFAEQFSVAAFERRMRDAISKAKVDADVSGPAAEYAPAQVIE